MASDMKDEGNDIPKVKETVSQPSKKPRKASGSPARRRTKTGCLTCRVRRIKCDEGRPTCKNCTKSRRECSGYPPPGRPALASTTFTIPPTFPTIESLPQSLVNHTQMSVTTGSPPLVTPTNVSLLDSTLHLAALGHHPHPRYEWNPFLEAGGLSDYVQYSSSNNPTQIHMPQPQHYIPVHLTTGIPHTMYSPYPDPSLAFGHADDPQSLYRRTQAQDKPTYLPQALPAYFHSFASGADGYEDPEDPWDIEADDDYPWYNIGIAVQRRAAQIVSPILQERNAVLLHHFVNFVRPCVNLYERQPTIGTHDGIKSAWGNTLPSAAISHPALGHAILGISALHLAVMYGNSDAAARKHILLSTKRISQILGDSTQRHRVEVLACVLLLAFYEVMDADHSKWVVHLSGAASFLSSEHDWAGMARTVYRMRAQAKINLAQSGIRHDRMAWSDYVRVAGIPEVLLNDEDWNVDENIIGRLTGQQIDYANCYHPCSPSTVILNDLTPLQAEEVMTKMELFWWMMKQLTFHSLLSGDPLLIPYEQLLCCPPRGRLTTSLIGAMDHLWLLLARLADFGAKDRIRKQKVVAKQGPRLPSESVLTKDAATSKHQVDASATGARGQDPPHANESRIRTSKNISHPAANAKFAKLFYGMMPPVAAPPTMINSFHVMDAELHKHYQPHAAETSAVHGNDLDRDTQTALAELASIADALELWKSCLGEDFHALRVHPEAVIESPFGPALRYNDPRVACCWAIYYLTKIMLRRFHPNSPPAMMASAGVNARLTESDALAIGRIFWGVLLDQKEIARQRSMNPTVVAALQELSFPLMFAGVQLQHGEQRAALIESLMDVGQETGWKTAIACASACETSWEKMGKMGKGHPYERTVPQRDSLGARMQNHRAHGSTSITISMKQDHEHELESRFISHDRNLIDKNPGLRSYWAMGVLSLDEDLKKMSLAK